VQQPSDQSRQQIEEEAARLLVRLSLDSSESLRRRVCRWIEEDPRHAVAFARAELAWGMAERLKASHAEDAGTLPAHPPQRRKPTIIGGIIAASVIVIGCIVGLQKANAVDRYRTHGDEMRNVRLSDGSVMHLSGASSVEVRYTGTGRQAHLLSGEVGFDVAHDGARPFDVAVGGTVIRATGTAFNVRMAPSWVYLAVTQGSVDVRAGATLIERVKAGNGAAIRGQGVDLVKLGEGAGRHRHGASSRCAG
jgi:transmembrane sensor